MGRILFLRLLLVVVWVVRGVRLLLLVLLLLVVGGGLLLLEVLMLPILSHVLVLHVHTGDPSHTRHRQSSHRRLSGLQTRNRSLDHHRRLRRGATYWTLYGVLERHILQLIRTT